MARIIEAQNPEWINRSPIKENQTASVIDFTDFQKQINRTSMPALYYIDRQSGLRRAIPGKSIGAITINKLGFRSPEISVKKSVNTLRIAFLGSSATFDPYVSSNEKTWPHQVWKILSSQFPDRKIEYLNAGLNGYSVKKAMLLYERFVKQLEADVVVICLNDINAATAMAARATGIYGGVHYQSRAIFSKSKFLQKIEKNLVVLWRLLFAYSERNKLSNNFSNVLQDSQQNLLELVQACSADGLKVMIVENGRRIRTSQTRLEQLKSATSQVFYLPYMSIPGYLRIQRANTALLSSVAASTNSHFVDLSDAVPPDRNHYVDTSHFTDAGSLTFARAVVEDLKRYIDDTIEHR